MPLFDYIIIFYATMQWWGCEWEMFHGIEPNTYELVINVCIQSSRRNKLPKNVKKSMRNSWLWSATEAKDAAERHTGLSTVIAHTYLYPLLHVQFSMVDNNKGHDYDPSLQMLTTVVDGEWAQVDELFLFFLNLGDGQDCKNTTRYSSFAECQTQKHSA